LGVNQNPLGKSGLTGHSTIIPSIIMSLQKHDPEYRHSTDKLSIPGLPGTRSNASLMPSPEHLTNYKFITWENQSRR
jgi:hypothetical protein